MASSSRHAEAAGTAQAAAARFVLLDGRRRREVRAAIKPGALRSPPLQMSRDAGGERRGGRACGSRRRGSMPDARDIIGQRDVVERAPQQRHAEDDDGEDAAGSEAVLGSSSAERRRRRRARSAKRPSRRRGAAHAVMRRPRREGGASPTRAPPRATLSAAPRRQPRLARRRRRGRRGPSSRPRRVVPSSGRATSSASTHRELCVGAGRSSAPAVPPASVGAPAASSLARSAPSPLPSDQTDHAAGRRRRQLAARRQAATPPRRARPRLRAAAAAAAEAVRPPSDCGHSARPARAVSPPSTRSAPVAPRRTASFLRRTHGGGSPPPPLRSTSPTPPPLAPRPRVARCSQHAAPRRRDAARARAARKITSPPGRW